ncbi:DUF3558 domain-containing protein [Amycolatopsis nigrescens]|uniref:DUF3558 domain-containing protein n=1 Tax=Amycolatopsis nigrescens TaxID=381445 RepID=UPI0003629C35|nr:DUF3558 domain-containing protein [Amycolatopsis nigrescens]
MARTLLGALGLAASAALLAACSGGGEVAGTPNTTSAPPAQSSSATGPSEAPRVSTPLPTDALLNRPCDALSAAQTTEIGMVDPQSSQTATGPQCRWRSASDRNNTITIQAVTANKGGLDDIYFTKPQSAYFEPVQIGGQPAVYTSNLDARPSGTCVLWVGATDQLAVSVGAQISFGQNKTNPCPVAQRAATAMVENLRG